MIVDQKQHVPSRWSEVWILRNVRSDDPPVSAGHFEIHQALTPIKGMGGDAISN